MDQNELAMRSEELCLMVKEIYLILDEQLYDLMLNRAMRLQKRKLWLKGWLRFHKIKREYRKLKKIRDICKV